jgi:hypothetical protein
MADITWLGGAAKDQAAIAGLHKDYLVANASFDWDTLQTIWSADPEATFFNMNGHAYSGRAHWTKLWQFYKGRVNTGEWVPYDVKGVISGDLATVWCLRKTRMDWIASEPRPNRANMNNGEFVSRSTMVFQRTDGEWRALHVHFSEASAEPRPGGI